MAETSVPPPRAPELSVDRPLTERETPLGRVRGFERAGALTFLGIPYGHFAGRFRPVDPPRPWSGTKDATRYAARCPQALVDDPAVPPGRGGMDEDCFHLNVHLPSDPDDRRGGGPRPVIVWIHGGGFLFGSANDHDGSALAVAADAVVVCLNYRLGPLGWLDMSELGPDYDASADLWLADQVAALEWVRDNIRAFGGDPGQVTVIGNSAGAASVLALYQVARARNLFHRAIACSPPHFPDEPRADLLALIAKKKRITRAEAVRWALTAEVEEVAAIGFAGGPVMTATGPLYNRSAAQGILELGPEAPPLLTGFTSDEGDFFLSFLTSDWRFRGPLGRLALGFAARSMLPACADGRARIEQYSRGLRRHHRARGRRRVELLFVDIFRRGSLTAARAAARAGSRAYLYELDVPCRINGRATGSAHGADQELTFAALADPEAWEPYRLVDPDLAASVAAGWVEAVASFVRTGSPDSSLGPWPAYDDVSRSSLLVSPGGSSVHQDRDGAHRRAVWGDVD